MIHDNLVHFESQQNFKAKIPDAAQETEMFR